MQRNGGKLIKTIKLYSDITVDLIPNDYEMGCEDEWPREDGEDTRLLSSEVHTYAWELKKAVEQRNVICDGGNLMCYYYDEDGVKEKIVSAVVSIVEHKGEVCACTTLQVKDGLTKEEFSKLFDYLQGQFSDGYGEGLEQQEIKVSDGTANLHLYTGNKVEFRIEDVEQLKEKNISYAELTEVHPRPAMDLVGHDGNIFAIMGRAAKVLREAGLNRESMEMRRRVQKCSNYYIALGIISEYVETELSEPRKSPPAPAKRKEGEAR